MTVAQSKVTITKFQIKGFAQLEKALHALTDDNFRTNALRAAGRKSMSPLLAALKAAAPLLQETSILPTGSVKNALRDGIKLRISANKNPKLSKSGKSVTRASKAEFRAVIATGQVSAGYALVSEYGRKETEITRYSAFGRVTKSYNVMLPTLQPKPWMRPTFDKHVAKVLTTFRSELRLQVVKKAKSQAKKRIKK